MNSLLMIARLLISFYSAFLFVVSGGDARLLLFIELFFLGVVVFLENPFFNLGGCLSLFIKSASDMLLSRLRLAILESFFICLT
jgi:hypothetical protein